jgi:hypothetical protein
MTARPVHEPADPCRVCGGQNFLATLILDKSGKHGRRYTDRYNILMTGALVRALSCVDCGTWKSAETVRSGPYRLPQPDVRQWMVDGLRALKRRQGYVVR